MALSYDKNGLVHPQEIVGLLKDSAFRRPMEFPERTQQMLDNSSFYVTVRDAGALVGFIRVLTDYVFYGVVTEVAVAPTHKGKGVGKEMLRLAREYATPNVTLMLTSSEEGEAFYEHLGWERMDRGFRLRREG